MYSVAQLTYIIHIQFFIHRVLKRETKRSTTLSIHTRENRPHGILQVEMIKPQEFKNSAYPTLCFKNRFRKHFITLKGTRIPHASIIKKPNQKITSCHILPFFPTSTSTSQSPYLMQALPTTSSNQRRSVECYQNAKNKVTSSS